MLAPLLLLVLAADPPAPIPSVEAARQICLATRPVDRVAGNAEQRDEFAKRRRALLAEKRLAVVPLAELEPGDPDEKERKVVLLRRDALTTREGVRVFTRQRRFELDAGPGLPAGDHAIDRAVRTLRERGTGSVRFTYDLGDPDGSGPCPVGSQPGSRAVLTVRPLELELLGAEGEVLATGHGSDAPEGRRAAGGEPSVEVAPATVTGKGPLAGEVTARAKERIPALKACFQEALARDGTLDGAVVFAVDIDAAGKGRKIVVSADAVQDESLVSCARQALLAVSWGKGGPSTALVPVHFERE